MKRWTQIEYDQAKPELTGRRELGTGDFRGVDFRGKHNVIIGPGSMLGDDVHLGVGCEIGARCSIGARFRDEGNLKVGKHCHFGEHAHIDENAIIDRGTCFATGVEICENVELGEDVQLPTLCGYLFDRRALSADGKSLIRLYPVAGRTICAFVANYEHGRFALIATRGLFCTVSDYVKSTKNLLDMAQINGTERNLLDAQDLYAAAVFLKEHFSRRSACA